MEIDEQHGREIRAARNQSLFRAVNEKMRELNDAFTHATETFVIACECADRNCVEMLDIEPAAYGAVRAEPRHFAVLPGHVYPDVETLVREHDGYVVVEKQALAGELAEAIGGEHEGA